MFSGLSSDADHPFSQPINSFFDPAVWSAYGVPRPLHVWPFDRREAVCESQSSSPVFLSRHGVELPADPCPGVLGADRVRVLSRGSSIADPFYVLDCSSPADLALTGQSYVMLSICRIGSNAPAPILWSKHEIGVLNRGPWCGFSGGSAEYQLENGAHSGAACTSSRRCDDLAWHMVSCAHDARSLSIGVATDGEALCFSPYGTAWDGDATTEPFSLMLFDHAVPPSFHQMFFAIWFDRDAERVIDNWAIFADRFWQVGKKSGVVCLAPGCVAVPSPDGGAGRAAWYGLDQLRIASAGLVVRPSSTNISLQSQKFGTLPNQKRNITVVESDPNIAAPDGLYNASRLLETAAGVDVYSSYQDIILPYGGIGARYQYSVWVRGVAGGRTKCTLIASLPHSGGAFVTVDLSDTWQRATVQFDPDALDTHATFSICGNDGVGIVYAGVAGKIICLAWQGQIERQMYPTSDIKTDAANATSVAPVYSVNDGEAREMMHGGRVSIDLDFELDYTQDPLFPASLETAILCISYPFAHFVEIIHVRDVAT